MSRYYYKSELNRFISQSKEEILGVLASKNEFGLDEQQRNAWKVQIEVLKRQLVAISGYILFEFSIPRMGRRVDCVILSHGLVFVLEFKVGSSLFDLSAIDQVLDYALDLKNFHEASHSRKVIPILIATEAPHIENQLQFDEDDVANPLLASGSTLAQLLKDVISKVQVTDQDCDAWVNSVYKPTPTIIEAAQALYRGHNIEEISRSDSGAINLSKTAAAIHKIIERSKSQNEKAICFLTGVPGAGKTLAGLNLANSWHDIENSEHAVFLSGNGPLVDVLREALARNEVDLAKSRGERSKKSTTVSKAKAFIQNIHHFRDDAIESQCAPIERVVVFDEAQRAWTLEQTSSFMKTKKGKLDFNQSEPEFLIGTMNRHAGYAVVICLIGGGQEINTGEAGLQEWFDSIKRSYPDWNVHVSSKLTDYEYTQGRNLLDGIVSKRLFLNDDLHLSVSVRSFRSEKVAAFVKATLDSEIESARILYSQISKSYPLVMTRNIPAAKKWLRSKARGSERFGIVASSGALRLKAIGFNVKASIDPVNWFLNPKSDVRSSFYLEDVATEFDVQGLELDWVCVAWDADLRHSGVEWELKSFRGASWQEVRAIDSRTYLKNAYRVLLTRARQGMVILIPEGNDKDPTRLRKYYDGVYAIFKQIGIAEIA